jgi:hypothetical protein
MIRSLGYIIGVWGFFIIIIIMCLFVKSADIVNSSDFTNATNVLALGLSFELTFYQC